MIRSSKGVQLGDEFDYNGNTYAIYKFKTRSVVSARNVQKGVIPKAITLSICEIMKPRTPTKTVGEFVEMLKGFEGSVFTIYIRGERVAWNRVGLLRTGDEVKIVIDEIEPKGQTRRRVIQKEAPYM